MNPKQLHKRLEIISHIEFEYNEKDALTVLRKMAFEVRKLRNEI